MNCESGRREFNKFILETFAVTVTFQFFSHLKFQWDMRLLPGSKRENSENYVIIEGWIGCFLNQMFQICGEVIRKYLTADYGLALQGPRSSSIHFSWYHLLLNPYPKFSFNYVYGPDELRSKTAETNEISSCTRWYCENHCSKIGGNPRLVLLVSWWRPVSRSRHPCFLPRTSRATRGIQSLDSWDIAPHRDWPYSFLLPQGYHVDLVIGNAVCAIGEVEV